MSRVINDIYDTYIDKQAIHIEKDFEDVEVSSRQSLPIGIIITELITNVIKYAFEGTVQGNRVSFFIDNYNQYLKNG
jgi:two-component sensor histidine kinase